MKPSPEPRERAGQVPFRSIGAYLLISFGVSWTILAFLLLLPAELEAIFGPLRAGNPLFILAVYSPALAAFGLVLHRAGLAGLRRYLSRLFLWRCHWGWYAYLLLGIPLLFYAGAVAKGTAFDPLPFDGAGDLLLTFGLLLFLGPIEEFGWRGLALPLLQQRYVPFWAGFLLGVVWGMWHLPAFFLGGSPQSDWSFPAFLIGATAAGVVLTPLFNASRGSLLLPILYHWQLINPVFPDAQPHDSLMFVAAAAVVTWIHRDTMFRKGDHTVTEVIPMTPPAGLQRMGAR